MYIIYTRLYSIVSSVFWNGFLHFESGLYIYCGVDNSENIIIKAAYNELLSHGVEKFFIQIIYRLEFAGWC